MVGFVQNAFRTTLARRGRSPEAVDTAGVSVIGMRYSAVIICGVLCGIAGAYMATGLQAGFVKDMTAGRGYIALAALIFAKWRPWYALSSCLLFGFLQAVALRPDLIKGYLGFEVQVQLLDALPYILTVVILAGFVASDPATCRWRTLCERTINFCTLVGLSGP